MTTAPFDDRPLVVFGAAGFVGTHLRRGVAGWAGGVTLISRRVLETGSGERLVGGDLTAPGVLAAQLPAGAIVVNLAYEAQGGHDANLALADGLVAICRAARASRLVHLSTAMVVGLVGQHPVTESTPCRPVTPYQRTKLDVEHHLRARLGGVCPVVVLRPTAVFGRGGVNLRKLVDDLTTRPCYENYLRGCLFGRRPMNLVPVETVAGAIRFAAQRAASANDLFLVADDEAAANNFRDVEHTLRQALGMADDRLPRLLLPTGLLATALRVSGRLSFDPATTFSSARLEQAGFVRPVTFAQALAAYAVEVRQRVGART